jgi:tetratricopeptide (TPR) repeat protein
VNGYTRADLLRILRITPRQFSLWERTGLVASAEQYSFADLQQIKKIRDLCAKRVRPATIRQSLEAMQRQVSGMSNPLLEATAFSSGSRVAFRHKGKVVEPVSGQFVIDFGSDLEAIDFASNALTCTTFGSPSGSKDPSSTNLSGNRASGRRTMQRMKELQADAEVSDLFSRGIALEEDSTRQMEAIETYQRVIDLEPDHAAAHINLGTLFYNRQEYASSEFHYRRAVEIDPRYALAYFDLGNVLDETGRVQDAIEAYRNALHLAPTYADAHYNLALAYEKIGEPRRALAHWKAYVKLDATGPWSTHARHQIRKILAADTLKLVYRKRG